ncbi:PREDICTED: uncharacterized protein LOC104805496 [Tarenaya hassleriana]|uniref:uncharacterized protein LOC104805496 n=1 Tax=Tarenaya hassleriana TaxID=28532 RepID=UPI00053C8BB9|nr:PREDICTED: uncharacterized protein LOC104805496 [Tarenaya hassleriana]XP_010528382.1 PREDICTED: uncharacterized protein LOC104805496 [Tarenaya hassleriana]XP_010528383.1 PREDICTED: uncharacterized protein LOC104805496 [Tarenaya hassleriana]
MMAEEATGPFRTPEVMKKQVDSNKLRGNSGGKASSSNSGQKELPHYLRASTGSCHDLCKYGRKHIPEEKPWRAKAKKTVKKLPDGMTKASSSGSSKTKKMIEVEKTQVLDCSDGISEIIKREVLKSSGSVSAMATTPPSEQSDSSLQRKKKTTGSKLKPSPVSGSLTSGNDNTQKQKVMSRSHSGRATLLSKGTKPDTMGLKPVMGKAKGVKGSDVKVEKKIGAKVASKKTAISPRALSSPKSSSIRIATNSSLRKSQFLKVAASTRNQRPSDVHGDNEPKQLDSYSVEEKTLHVVEMEAENWKNAEQCGVKPSPPPPSSSSSSSTKKDGDLGDYEEYTVSEAGEYDCASGSSGPERAEEEDETLGGENKPRASNNGDSARTEAGKLHFRRGRVVDVNSENDSPRRIKFRRGRALGENQTGNGHGKRRSFKRKDDIAEDDDNGDDHAGENVVLRHQEVKDKKEEQGLFNNVIEETASKLVETRKSKVKALVGAFETVISLQESKPVTNSTT